MRRPGLLSAQDKTRATLLMLRLAKPALGRSSTAAKPIAGHSDRHADRLIAAALGSDVEAGGALRAPPRVTAELAAARGRRRMTTEERVAMEERATEAAARVWRK